MPMAYELDLDETTGLARVTFLGSPRYRDVADALRAVVRDGAFIAPRRLWDLRSSDLFLSHEEIQKIGELAQSFDTGPQRTAILVDRQVDYGQGRVFHAYRQTETTDVRVFWSEDEAVAWLLDERS